MSATIRVDSGIAAGTTYWIDRPVLRIGSDPHSDVCLPSEELAPHTLTLEFRGGNYRVYNRSSSPVTVGSATIQAGGNAVWNDGESIELPGNQQLALMIDGDPRPSPRPESVAVDDVVVEETAASGDGTAAAGEEAAAKKKSSGTVMQLAVIGFCVAAMAFMLTSQGEEETEAPNRPTFDTLVRTALAKDENDPVRAIVPKLQYSQSALVRGNYRVARIWFLKLRDQLVRQVETLPEKNRPDVKQVLEYVEYRLSEMPPPE